MMDYVKFDVNASYWDLLTVVFVILKLTSYIDWSWVWVLSPQWVSLIIILLIKD